MKLKTWGVAAALAVAMGGASAAITDPTGGVLDLSSGSDTFAGTVNGAFTDLVTFTLPTAYSVLGGGVFSFAFGASDVDLSSVSLSGGSLASPLAFTQSGFDPGELWTLTTGTLTNVGTYTITLIGTGRGTYSGEVAVQAVPEPATLALALAGLAVLPFLRRRQKSKTEGDTTALPA